jgi:flagellar basal-body rod protein FlgC
MFGVLDVSTSALVAQRINLDTIAGNLANMNATRDADGNPNPYRRRVALLATGDASGSDQGGGSRSGRLGDRAPGVHVAEIVEDPAPFRLVHDPNHPDAIRSGPNQGYVRLPNVDLSTEMINALWASRIYEANATVMEVTKDMMESSLRLLA